MIRVVIADHHRLFRTGLRKILKEVKSITVVGEAANGEDAIEAVRQHRPHVALMEIAMPGIGGIEAARRIMRVEASTRIVMITGAQEEPFPSQALRSGISGFVSKQASIEDVVSAIKYAYLGQKFVSSDIAQSLAVRAFDEKTERPFDDLSSRELQIMMMVINCLSVQDISDKLHLSPKTINSYRYRIFTKLGIANDVELTWLAMKHGISNPLFDSPDDDAAQA